MIVVSRVREMSTGKNNVDRFNAKWGLQFWDNLTLYSSTTMGKKTIAKMFISNLVSG